MEKETKLISIIAPCFNEELNIEIFYEEIKSVFETLQDYEDDFRKNWKNQDWQPTNTSTETKTKKILSDNNSHINHQYNVYATENGLEQFNGMYHDYIKKYY